MTEPAKTMRLGDLGEQPMKASARDETTSDTSGELPSTAMIRDRFSVFRALTTRTQNCLHAGEQDVPLKHKSRSSQNPVTSEPMSSCALFSNG